MTQSTSGRARMACTLFFALLSLAVTFACGDDSTDSATSTRLDAGLGIDPQEAPGADVELGDSAANTPPLDAGVDAPAPGDAGACVCPAPPTCVTDAAPPSDAGGSALFPLLISGARTINLVADGDSRVLDAYLDGGSPWPQLAAMLAGPDVRVANVAQAGSNTSFMLQRAAANVDPLYDEGAYRNVIVAMVGVNDIRSLTATSQLAPAEANLAAYGQARLAKGWSVYLLTDPPAALELRSVWDAWVAFERTGPAGSTPFATAAIEAPAPFDDFLLGVDPRWSKDGIHPTQSGATRLADRIARFLATL